MKNGSMAITIFAELEKEPALYVLRH